MADTEIYLFTGPEAGEKNEAIAAIKAAAQKKNGTLDDYRYFASDVRVADVVAQLQNVGLFSSAVFIVLRNAELIKTKDDLELLASWAKSGDAANTLILVSDENSVDKKLESLVPSNHKKVFWEMFENRKEQWLISFFKKNGFSIEPDAVSEILEMIENNTESLKNECSRFFYCYEKGAKITVSDVDKILSHNREESAFTLFEAMADKTKNALEILNKIRVSRENNGVMIIAGLTYCFRQLRGLLNLTAGRPVDETVLKQAGIFGKKNQEKYKSAASVWNAGQVASIIALLASTDMNIRESGSAFEDTSLVLLIHSIVMKNGIFPAEYEVPAW